MSARVCPLSASAVSITRKKFCIDSASSRAFIPSGSDTSSLLRRPRCPRRSAASRAARWDDHIERERAVHQQGRAQYLVARVVLAQQQRAAARAQVDQEARPGWRSPPGRRAIASAMSTVLTCGSAAIRPSASLIAPMVVLHRICTSMAQARVAPRS